jgi:hypothetical protein
MLLQRKKVMGISEYPARADKSAMGTMNRPLQLIGLFCWKPLCDHETFHEGLNGYYKLEILIHQKLQGELEA